MINVAIIIGSTRPGRRGDAVARWVHDIAGTREDAAFTVVDLADFELPLLDEPVPAAMSSSYEHEHTRRWAAAIAACDAFVFVTPVYNRAPPASLKNALDYLYAEWQDKAAGFVSYGVSGNGGSHAVEHLRLVMGELHIADVRDQVDLSLIDDLDDGELAPRPHQLAAAHRMLDQLVAWGGALHALRSRPTSLTVEADAAA